MNDKKRGNQITEVQLLQNDEGICTFCIEGDAVFVEAVEHIRKKDA